jgi:hypothetical protein
MQADILHSCPDNRQATGLRGEDVDLIGALAHEALETLKGIGGLNVSVHGLRKGIKGQKVLFIFNQASHRLWIALRILGSEGGQAGQSFLFGRLIPDAHEFGLNLTSLSSRDGIEHIALLMHQTALTKGSRKLFSDRRKPPIMPIRHEQIDVCSPS